METKKPRGLAAMTKEQRSRIARLGGRAAHASGKAHEFNSDTARAANQKSQAAHAAKRAGGNRAA